MNYTDKQLKRALAKMLPDNYDGTIWSERGAHRPLLDTELLHLCWLVEETLSSHETCHYLAIACDWSGDVHKAIGFPRIHATWQQRVIALAKVKGIEL